jgi:signal transduction histidine kinase
VEAFWSSIQTTIQSPELSTAAGAYEFLQSEIVPRRTAAGALLRELEIANERAMRQSESEFRKTRQNAIYRLFVVVGLCVLLAGAIAWLSLRWAARSERESVIRFEETAQARRDLQQLSARLLQVQEDEWSRLSRELHDEIGQTLTALRIEISGALAALRTEPDAAEQRLGEARLLAERTVETVRNISRLLRPSLLDDLGLEPALQSLVEEFNRRGTIACDFAGEEIAAALPDSHRTCVYRVVQEALTNCARHSQARRATVRLWQSGGELNVEIHDDGKGFPAGPRGGPKGKTGLGILGMRERVAALGGELAIESAPGGGTRVSARLPLPFAPAAKGEGGTDGDPDLVSG